MNIDKTLFVLLSVTCEHRYLVYTQSNCFLHAFYFYLPLHSILCVRTYCCKAGFHEYYTNVFDNKPSIYIRMFSLTGSFAVVVLDCVCKLKVLP